MKSAGEFFFLTNTRSREAVAIDRGGEKVRTVEPKGKNHIDVNCQGNHNPEDGPALARLSIKGLRRLLQSCATPHLGSYDPRFTVEATLNKQVFVGGEQATLSVKCSQACHLAIFNLDATGHFTRLYPSERLVAGVQPLQPLRADQELLFPPPQSGLSLELRPLVGYSRNTEAFLILATKPPLDRHALLNARNPVPMGDLFRLLRDLPTTEWAQVPLVYEVRNSSF